jgi:neutral amino acid transport system ATP-binding protein
MNDFFSIINLTKRFGGLEVLKGINLKLKMNTITGLIGPNGCGKTTTFNIISGLLPCDSGEIKLNRTDLTNLKPHEINQLGLSRTFQNTRLWRNLTVIENLLIPPKNQKGNSLLHAINPLKPYKKQEDSLLEKAFGILELLEIDEIAHNYASDLSGGQSKLVDIGRVLMSDPKILLLDEPVAGVAGPLAEKIFENMKKLRDDMNISILLIEHNMEFVLRKGIDNIYVMAQGEIIANGTPDEIRSKQEVIDVYLGE